MKDPMNTKLVLILTLALLMVLMVIVPIGRAAVTVKPGGVAHVGENEIAASAEYAGNNIAQAAGTGKPQSVTKATGRGYNEVYSTERDNTRIELCVEADADSLHAKAKTPPVGKWQGGDYYHCTKPGSPGGLHLLSTSPAANATVDDANFTVMATFDSKLKDISVNDKTFYLVDQNGIEIPATVQAQDDQARLHPLAALEDGVYTATLKGGIEGANGSQLGRDYKWSFSVDHCVSGQVTLPEGSCVPPK